MRAGAKLKYSMENENNTPAPVVPTPEVPTPVETPPLESMPESFVPETPAPVSELEAPVAAVVPPPPDVMAPPPKKSSGSGMKKVIWLFIVLILIAAAAFGAYKMTQQKADKKTAELNSQIAVLNSNEHILPAGTIKVSDCIPNMGYHYLTKSSDPEYGPFLILNKKNKVIGVEYMVSKAMYTAIPKTDPPVELITKDSPMYGWKFDHADVSHLPKGHEGLMVDHIDVHLYTVTADQQKQACI